MSYKENKAPLGEIAGLLPDAERVNLFSFIERTKTTPRWYATNSFNVRYKNGIIYRFSISGDGYWQINLTLAKPSDLDETLLALPEDEREYFIRNLRRCRQCNPKHGKGKRFVILGREHWGCAEPEVEVTNPSAGDIDMLCRYTEVRKQNILRRLTA